MIFFSVPKSPSNASKIWIIRERGTVRHGKSKMIVIWLRTKFVSWYSTEHPDAINLTRVFINIYRYTNYVIIKRRAKRGRNRFISVLLRSEFARLNNFKNQKERFSNIGRQIWLHSTTKKLHHFIYFHVPKYYLNSLKGTVKTRVPV